MILGNKWFNKQMITGVAGMVKRGCNWHIWQMCYNLHEIVVSALDSGHKHI